MFNGKKVFLSGVNFAWNSYGYDFGNGQYNSTSKSMFNNWLAQIAANGGNSVRESNYYPQNFFFTYLFMFLQLKRI